MVWRVACQRSCADWITVEVDAKNTKPSCRTGARLCPAIAAAVAGGRHFGRYGTGFDLGGVQILLQGGLNPDLPITYYEELFRWMKANFPLAIHGLSPEEIRYIAEIENLSIRAVVERLIAAGLDSIPGGGAEILDDEIRYAISPLKCTTDVWLEVMRQGHALGLRTTATMVFGFGEQPRHIISHLDRLRALQDQTAGFTAFICWPFQAEGTRLKLRDDTTAMRYLRVFALARLYLDNFPSLQVSWPTMGPEVGQVALRFGGNDFGSAMIEENVVSQAGAVFKLSAQDIERLPECLCSNAILLRHQPVRRQPVPRSVFARLNLAPQIFGDLPVHGVRHRPSSALDCPGDWADPTCPDHRCQSTRWNI
jgi:CofH subfamily radical SAM domain protein